MTGRLVARAEAGDIRIPVHVITGFLGSGKTTLLKALLAHESFGDSAILVNEFGAVGLDNQLLGNIDQETVLLSSGCVCCSIRGELSEALQDLYTRRHQGDIPPFERVVLETTGLADPGPIAATIASDPVLRHHYRPGTTLTVVDALNACENHISEPVWADQVAFADVFAITKTDLVPTVDAEATRALVTRVNTVAREISLVDSVAQDINDVFLQPTTDLADSTSGWTILGPAVRLSGGLDRGHQRVPRHPVDDVHSFDITLPGSLDWTCFGVWLSLLLHRHGRNILRTKGILVVDEASVPLVIHGVQHTLFPPEHLPTDQSVHIDGSRLVFITRGITRVQVLHSLNVFLTDLRNQARK